MRKIMLAGLVLAVGMFGILRNAYCASVGAPGTQPGKFSIGLEQDYIFERDMGNEDYYSINGVEEIGIIEYKVQDLGRTMLRAGYQISKNLNIYTKLGVTNDGGGFGATNKGTFIDSGATPPDDSGTYKMTMDMEGDSAFVWGLGFKLLFPLKNNWIIGADAQYLTHENDYSGKATIKVINSVGDILFEDAASFDGGSATISEWHVAPFVAKDLGKVVPYVGVKYSDLQIDVDDASETLDAENNVGVFVGADFKFNKTFALNLEGRFFDETAMSLAAMFTF